MALLIQLLCRLYHAKCWPNKSQAGINIVVRNMNNLRYVDDTSLKEEIKEELKSILMSLKEESENACFTVNTQKTKIMASVLIISCKVDVEKWKQWQTLFSWAPVSLWILTSGMKLKDAGSFKGKLCEI